MPESSNPTPPEVANKLYHKLFGGWLSDDPTHDFLTGEGSMQLVYIDAASHFGRAGSEDPQVWKLSKVLLRPAIVDPSDMLGGAYLGWIDDLQSWRQRYQEMDSYFGNQMVLLEEPGVVRLELTPEEVAQIKPQLLSVFADGQEKLWFETFISLQDYAPELEPSCEGVFSLSSPYAERGRRDAHKYAAASRRWYLDSAAPLNDQEIEDFLSVHEGPGLPGVVREIKLGNQALREAVGDFAESAIAYSDETGRILDLRGTNNVVVTIGGVCKLIDALYPRDSLIMHELVMAQACLSEGLGLSYQQRLDFLNGRNYVCLINFLAALSGSESRLLVRQLRKTTPDIWARALSQLAVSEKVVELETVDYV